MRKPHRLALPPDSPTPLEALTPPPGWPELPPSPAAPGDLLERVRHTVRLLHYSPRTEEACVDWARRFALHCGPARPPAELGADEVRCFLTDLAVTEHVSASTQNQALCALVFLHPATPPEAPRLP